MNDKIVTLYATKANIEAAGSDQVSVELTGIDLETLLNDFYVEDVLKALDFADVAKFVSDNDQEVENERSY